MEIILLVLIVVVFLGLPVLSMRKQSKQINEIKSFQSQLEPGMIVQMTSGIHVRIVEVGTTTVDVELAPGITTTWDRSAVLKAVETEETVEPVGADDSVESAEDVEGIDGIEGIEDFDTVEPFEDRKDEAQNEAQNEATDNPSNDSERKDDGDTPRS